MSYTTIDLDGFLHQQRVLKHDFLLGFTKLSDDGKVLKIPAKGINDFTNPSILVRETEVVKMATKNVKQVPYPIVGIILKAGEGLKVFDRQLIVLDIDCKNAENKEIGEGIFNEVLDYLVEHLSVTRESLLNSSEKTISGGYHIFLTSNGLYPQKRLEVLQGIEIEIFTQNRYIAVAPSIGYSTFNSHEYVNILGAYDNIVSSVDLDYFCNHFHRNEEEKEKNKVDFEDLEINENCILDNVAWEKITKKWLEFENFCNGKSDKDWDNVTKGSTYDYVRHNIMPMFALFDKQDEFAEIIAKYGKKYAGQWKDYPQNWLDNFKNGIIILGKEARIRLFKLGFFKNKKAENSRANLIEDFVLEHMPNLFKYVLVMYDAIYYYNEAYHCYVYLEHNLFYETLGLYYKNKLGMILKPDDYRVLQETFNIYAKIFSVDVAHANYIHYELLRDKSYQEQVVIVFKNGTLYVTNDDVRFAHDFFNPLDKALFSIQHNYDGSLLKNTQDSVIMNWFYTKFQKTDLDFIQMFFGNLLVPAYSPSIMLVLYSYKGALGKSNLVKALSSVFDIGSNAMITTFPLTRLDDRFGGGNLSRALLNITTEMDGSIDSEAFKSVVSREKWLVENKFENAKFEIPLAKHISMANDVPKISVDGGVARRLAVFELSEERAMAGVEAHEYEQLFLADSKNMISFMLQGLFMLQKVKFADLSNYYRTNFEENIKMMREYNSNVYEWFAFEGFFMIREATEREKGITEDNCYLLYTQWCKNMNIDPVKKRTMVKYILSLENICKTRPTISGIRERRIAIK